MSARPLRPGFVLIRLAVFMLLFVAAPALSGVEEGARIYGEKGCSNCHLLDGEGNSVGPELSAEGTKAGRDRDWHVRHLLDPAAVVPGSIMPMMVTEAEAAHLADYLLSLGVQADTAAAMPVAAPEPVAAPDKSADPAPLPVGSPARGQTLFADKGCPACHAIRGTGGTLGPDLTFEGEVAGHDADWHIRHLTKPAAVVPGSTMPPYVLTATQGADLAAYLMSLVHLSEDRALSPDLSARFAGMGGRLEQYRQRVEHARGQGRNVDDLTVQLAQAWTHVGAVEQMVRDRRLTGAAAEIDTAEDIAAKLDAGLSAFEQQLAARVRLITVVVLMLLLGAALVTWKVRLLNREWAAAESAAAAEKKSDR